MLHCPTCGRKYDADVKVCPEDGTALQADATVAGAAAAAVANETKDDPLIGRTFDEKYRLDDRLGEGGMGTVYRATHLLIDRPVAIKVLNPRFVSDEAAQERFRREARAAGRLQHTNAVAVTDFGRTTDGFVYIVMELLEGRSLRDVLAREAPLDTARAVSLMLQISAAVAAAHEAGIIHRDLKPGNIFVVQRKHAPPVIKVLDFGIAKLATDASDKTDGTAPQTLTQTGVMIGTPRYMSPEQCDGAELTPASDVYSLGIILYEMLTGVTPFTGSTPLAVALKHSSEVPRRPREIVFNIPAALEDVVLQTLEKKPGDRPPDAGAFRRELYMTAERLGLEHAAGFSAPTLETLRNAGTETPSGRLVIDIERLRENRAASSTTKVSGADTAEEQVVQTGGAPVTSPDSSSANLASHEASPVARVEVSLERKRDWRMWLRQPLGLLIVGLVAFFLVALIAILISRSSRSTSPANDNDEAMGRLLTPGNTGPRRNAPSREPQSAAEFYERATYYLSTGGYDAAIKDYRRAIELQKDFPSARNRLGQSLMMKGQFAAAADEFRAAIKQKGGTYPAAYYNLGFALQQQGDSDNAINAYNSAISQRGGTYPDAYYQIGMIHLNQRRDAEATDALRKAIAQNNGRDADAQFALGTSLARQKDYEAAEAAMRAAIDQRNGEYAEAHYNLGLLYEVTERPAEAIKEYETYLQQRPDAFNRQVVEKSVQDLRRRVSNEESNK